MPFWAAALKGSMIYAFTHMGNFFLLLLFLLLLRTPPPLASRPISQPGGPYLSLEAHIPALRPKSQSWDPNPNLKAQIPTPRPRFQSLGIFALRLGFGPGSWASRLRYGPRGWGVGGCGGGGEGGGENSPYMWKHRSLTPLGPLPCFPLNLNHSLLKQGTGTADHLTLLRLLTLASWI